MNLKNVEKKENNSASFQVETDKAEFESAVNKAYLKAKSDIYIPGFRKGQGAPRCCRGYVRRGRVLSGRY